MINCSPSARERRLSLWVDDRSQGGRCSDARDVCCTRQQTGDLCADPFLRFRQCGSCRPQVISFCGRVGRIQLRGLAKGGGRWRRRTSRASVARGERASCAEQRTGGATSAQRRKCENALELRGRAPAEFPDQAFARESTLDKETALWARWGAHRARVVARRQRFGVAGRCDVHRGGDVRAGQRAGSGSVQSARLVWRRR